jgi:RNA polymerase sigma-70 factor (ECF subfamily)
VTDTELIARVVDGDREAFNQIMRIHEDRVFSVCLRMMTEREAALDATQETFITVFRKAAQFKGEAALGTWIYRIAVNTCYDHLRKSKRRPVHRMPEHHDEPDPSAQSEVESAGLRPDIEKALVALPREFRSAVILSDIEGLALSEVARILGVPVGTVKSRVFRGRRLLAGLIGNQIET